MGWKDVQGADGDFMEVIGEVKIIRMVEQLKFEEKWVAREMVQTGKDRWETNQALVSLYWATLLTFA